MGLIKINNLECLSPFELNRVIEDAKAQLFKKTSEQKAFFEAERINSMKPTRKVLEGYIERKYGCNLATFVRLTKDAAVKGKAGRPKTKVKKG